MNWLIPSWLSKNSPTDQETTTTPRDDKRNSITARESDVDKEREHDEMQPHKMQRKTDEQSMVIYGLEQGSSSNSHQLSCDNLDGLSSYSAKYPNIGILQAKFGHLSARRFDVLTELEHAAFQPGKKRKEEVHHWLTLVPRKKDEILSVIKDDEGSSSNSNLHGHIERFIKEVDELFQRGRFPNGLVVPDQESTRLPLLLGKEPIGMNFKRNAKQILEWLQNHEHSIIGVYGMGGVGKTTLLLHIHDQLLKYPNLYGQVYWVTVSQNCTVQKLQEDIARVIGVERLGEHDERKRASILHNKLASMGPTILILDDMWERILGEKVGIPLERSSCKLIISTRHRDLCLKMGCKDCIIKAEILSDVEAWGLFLNKLGNYDKLEEEAKELARLVAQECGCLPLAIATMASSMIGVVDINEWKNVLNELKCRRGQDDMNENVLQILQFSYDCLKEEMDKNCFLSCVLYGEDEKISRDTLIDMWINEGLFDKIEDWENRVAKGHSILNKLESWCLLESCRLFYKEERCVKMHDLVRDMAISITQKHPRFLAKAGENLKKVPNEEQWSNDLVKVSLSHNEIKEIPSGMAPMTPNLTMLMLNENKQLKKIPDSFFQHMKALKLLDLSDTSIERVPESVSDLENLRALSLSNCYALRCVPESFFQHMKALKVLNLSRTRIERVPESVSDLENLRELLLNSCEMLRYVPTVAKLTKLRVLDLSSCYELEAEPRGLERLKSVEVVGYCPWDISDMTYFNKFMQSSWISLTSYRIWIRDPKLFTTINEFEIWQRDMFWENYERGMLITGWKYREEERSWMLPKTLEKLKIEKSDLKGRSLVDVLPSLNEATNLKEIILEECRGMISITKVGGALDSFSHLTQLDINRCGNMKVVFSFMEHPPHLPNLRVICIGKCEEVEEIFHSDDGASQSVSPPQSNPIILSLPKLQQLFLDELPKLKAIISNLYIDVPKLHHLYLRKLPKLKLPSTQQLHLLNLKDLLVEDCEEVEEIFQIYKSNLPLPNLKYLELINLPKLKWVLPTTEQLHLPNLEYLTVEDCEEVEEIFQINKPNPAFHKLKCLCLRNLPKLKWVLPITEQLQISNLQQKLRVEDCEEVDIFQIYNPDHGLPNLKWLTLENLPKLKRVFPCTEHPLHLVRLVHIKVLNCAMLRSICRGLIFFPSPCIRSFSVENCPKLKVFQFEEGNIIVDSKSTIECTLNNTQFWETLQQDYPHKAHFLSNFINQGMELWQGLDDDNDDGCGDGDGDGAEGDGGV